MLSSMPAAFQKIARSDLIRILLFMVIASIVSYTTMTAIVRLNAAYYNDHALLGDTSSFYSEQFKVYDQVLQQGKVAAVWSKFLEERKNPALYLSFIVLPKKWLLWHSGHLFFTAIALIAFLTMLSICVLQADRLCNLCLNRTPHRILRNGMVRPELWHSIKVGRPPGCFLFRRRHVCSPFV